MSNRRVAEPTYFMSQTESACGDGYRVRWRINPHMRPGSSCRYRARAQHEALRQRLEALGARARSLPFLAGCYDSVFVKDVALLGKGRSGRLSALMARPRHDERSREIDARARTFESLGFETRRAEAHLEGGDVVWTGRRALVGYGFRSERSAAREVTAFTGHATLPVRLVDPAFYHLDTALAYLRGGEMLVAEGAIARSDLARLHDLPEVTSVIEVPRAAAMHFGLNLVAVGNDVVLSHGAEWVAERLRMWGYRPHLLALDQFHLAGGSAACLTAPVVPLRAEHAALAA